MIKFKELLTGCLHAMHQDNAIQYMPWDAKAFGIDSYEITKPTSAILEQALTLPGHYTVKIDPLSSKALLHQYGFYYCDTLLTPICSRANFKEYVDSSVSISRQIALESLSPYSQHLFVYGRFYRDFNMDPQKADRRYQNWLMELARNNNVYVLFYDGIEAGFIGVNQNQLILHALNDHFRGKGLAKFLWTAVCHDLFDRGFDEVMSSISAANLPVLNLYSSLGFRFVNAVDVYHRVVT